MGTKAQTTVTFAVTIVLPEGVHLNDMREYIRDAVGCWKDRSPENVNLVNLDTSTIRVTLMKRVVTYGN